MQLDVIFAERLMGAYMRLSKWTPAALLLYLVDGHSVVLPVTASVALVPAVMRGGALFIQTTPTVYYQIRVIAHSFGFLTSSADEEDEHENIRFFRPGSDRARHAPGRFRRLWYSDYSLCD